MHLSNLKLHIYFSSIFFLQNFLLFVEFNSVLNRMLLMTNANVDSMRVHHETWAQQLKDAMNVNGGDVENATAGDYVMHFLTFGFKVSRLGLNEFF